jgi:23S rRNA (uracil1939-C5)-methyltransferase
VAEGRILAHLDDGRVVLVEGGLPGETVSATVTLLKKRLITASVSEVLQPTEGRVQPPCPYLASGCGGCDYQHASPELQHHLKAEVIRDALGHVGGGRFASLPIRDPEPIGGSGPALRTTVRVATSRGRGGFRHRHSNEVLEVPECLVSHPALNRVLDKGRFGEAKEVIIRTSVATGELMAVVDPHASKSWVPEDVSMIGLNKLRAGKRLWMTEAVDGHEFRVSALSFFQAHPEGAAALGRAVSAALPGFDGPRDRLVDLYGGVGLFTVLLGATNGELVESSRSSVADARRNTEDLGTRVVRSAVERWRPSRANAVVADPPRSGLGAKGADAVAATGAAMVALVSCDPASMARDLNLLSDRGYEPTWIQPVDMFPHTHHIEAVTALKRQ